MTWQELIEEEPRLKDLEARIRQVKSSRNFCANAVWYGYSGGASFRNEVVDLVGWHNGNPALRSMGAYSTAYDYLYGLLPDCKHAGDLC